MDNIKNMNTINLNDTVVKLEHVTRTYKIGENEVHALRGVSFEIKQGEFLAIMGPSGSGKSTCMNMIGCLDRPTSGKIQINGKFTSQMTEKELANYRRNNLGFVFQFYNLIPNLTIKENIEVCAYLSKEPLDIDDLLDTLGLTEHKDKFPNQLSGGQQQRCAIGRALVKNPQILLCDEPTGALDYSTSKDILELIEKINQKYHNTIIIVTHNQAISMMADRILKLRDGKITSNKVNEKKLSAKDLEW